MLFSRPGSLFFCRALMYSGRASKTAVACVFEEIDSLSLGMEESMILRRREEGFR